MKFCKKCNTEKEYVFFYIFKNNRISTYCKTCTNLINNKNKKNNKEKIELQQKEYRRNNKEKKKLYNLINKDRIKEQRKEYRKLNKDKIKEQRKEYRKLNKDKINNYRKQKMLNDPLFKLSHTLRNLIKESFKKIGYNKESKTYEILGCSFEEFKIYIEEKFDEFMSWENHGTYWHLDHIIPISWANNEEEVYKLNNYKNFQPLSASENLAKNNRFAG
jgi:hypothetical protein